MAPFSLFGTQHLLTVLFIALLLLAFVFAYIKASPKGQTLLTRSLAICCLLSYPLQWVLTYSAGYYLTLEGKLPFHLCDLAAFICGIALLSRSERFKETAYYWGLAGTLQGLITPDVSEGFPSPLFFSFFWNHGFIVIVALFLPLALKWRPQKNALWRVFGLTQLYLIFALSMNYLLNTNFGFLHHKPSSATLLDHFPDWPWYILVLEALCLGLFFLLTLPFTKKSAK